MRMVQNGAVSRAGSHSGAIDGRYRALDAWRGVAALMVALYHMPLLHSATGAKWFANAELFVDFFFVLSGFVICHAYGDRVGDTDRAGRFMIRRFGRTWPLHAAVLSGFAALEALKLAAHRFGGMPLEHQPFTENFSPDLLLSNLLFTQAFNLHGMTSWNYPAWSVAVEFYAYAAFALIVVAAGARAAVFLTAAVATALALAVLSPRAMFATHDFGFLRCIYGFFLGCVACRAVAHWRFSWSGRLATALELSALAAVAVFLALTADNATSFLAPLLFAAVVLIFSRESGAISNLMRRRTPQALGRWSYSIYMIHALVFAAFAIVAQIALKFGVVSADLLQRRSSRFWEIDSALTTGVVMMLLLAIIVALAAFSYRFIEEPARLTFNRLASRTRKPVAFRSRRLWPALLVDRLQEHRKAQRTFRPGTVA